MQRIKDEIDREVGIDCWMDLSGIESGEEFIKTIISAINRHDTILFMLSKASMESVWALKELDFANKKRKRIVLVDIDHAEMTDEFYFLYSDKDNIDWSNPLQHDKLIRNLKSWFKTKDKKNNDTIIKNTEEGRTEEPPVLLHRAEGIEYCNFVGPDGKVVLSEKWKDACNFQEGLAAVSPNNYYNFGFIDKNGIFVIEPQWEEASYFSEGLAAVRKKSSLFGYIDKTGKTIIPPNWEWAGDFHDGLAPVGYGEYYGENGGYIDKTARLIIATKWNAWGEFHEGLAPVKNNKGRWGFINTKGQEVLPCQWRDVGLFYEGLAPVRDIRGEWCYINSKGAVKIPSNSKWKVAGFFGNGLAPVMNWDGQWGYIDTKGNLVHNYQWFEAERFEHGVAWVKTVSPWKLINTKGQYVNTILQI